MTTTLSPRRFCHENIAEKIIVVCCNSGMKTHTLNSLTVNTILESEGSGVSSEGSGIIKPQSRYGLAADWFP